MIMASVTVDETGMVQAAAIGEWVTNARHTTLKNAILSSDASELERYLLRLCQR
jgi:hypothetical protein